MDKKERYKNRKSSAKRIDQNILKCFKHMEKMGEGKLNKRIHREEGGESRGTEGRIDKRGN